MYGPQFFCMAWWLRTTGLAAGLPRLRADTYTLGYFPTASPSTSAATSSVSARRRPSTQP
jgi:hypothetical protein